MMQEIKTTDLPHKYENELHCNEVMLLPYYIASMNIEHAYFDRVGGYKAFSGICLVDTFELAESKQVPMFTEKNTERVERQRQQQIFVIIGNPPYNAGQVDENDNNKNRKYPAIERRIYDTSGKHSTASLLRKQRDPYIKAIRWASDRIKDEGIVCLVTNSSFVHDHSLDGVRGCLETEFDAIYVLDLGGNVRKNPKLSGTTHNVFGIQPGVSVNILVRREGRLERKAAIRYAAVDAWWRKEQKYGFLEQVQSASGVEWRLIKPDSKHNWVFETSADFETLLPFACERKSRSAGTAIFETYCLGVSTNRDETVYDFSRSNLSEKVRGFLEAYGLETLRYAHAGRPKDLDDFLDYEHVKWSETLKKKLVSGAGGEFDAAQIRESVYRPFSKEFLYYDGLAIDRPAAFREIFPTKEREEENAVICSPTVGARAPFWCFSTNRTPNLNLVSIDATQCFPFYTYVRRRHQPP